MDRAKRFKLQVAVSMVFTFVIMLTAVKMGWAQSSDDAYKIERFAVNDGVKINVETSGGSIDVIGKDTDEVTVEMYVRKRNKYVQANDEDLKGWEIEISERNNTVTAHAKRENSRNWNWNRNTPSISFVVYAPVRSTSDVRTSGGSIELINLEGSQTGRTSGGSIVAEDIRGEVNIRTSGGSITLSEIVGTTEARTSGGRIRAENVDGNLDVKTSGGSISLEGISGSVDASTSGGSINAEVTNPNDFINLRTSGGSITVTVPEEKGYDLDLDGNRVRAELKNFTGEYERDEVKGSVNGGGIRIKAKTSGGSIRLNYK
ncbi:DUF4097 family beta strand repeat-containing protein [Balneola sp. EhC07]|uniref:DUF4097 family beta strand repeat-containing protein n=1 Tax=Balneola sp. EhC07 TaxID=1849360 RepID=UPI0009EE2DC6|nr:DUF4097 family beta strand repeat-containing protein [Balneola sp. EhC07]